MSADPAMVHTPIAAATRPTHLLTKRLRRDKGLLVGSALFVAILIGAIFAPWITSFEPDSIDLINRLEGPAWTEDGSAEHVLGTDALGRDQLTRLLYSARVSLRTGFLVVLLAGSIGTLLGLIAGYRGRWLETVIMRLVDASIAFPGLLLALAVIAMIGPGETTIIIILGAISWMVYTRVAHDLVLSLREISFVRAAETTGSTKLKVMTRHLLPNLLAPLLTVATLEFAHVVLAESALSYLGFGVQPPDSSWGLMVAESQEYISGNGWLVAIPGFAIGLTVLSLNLISSGLRSVLTPQHSQAQAAAAGRLSGRRRQRDIERSTSVVSLDNGSRMDKALLAVRDLNVTFESDTGPIHAVRGVDIAVHPGEVVAIVGESGSGKSATAMALMDILPASAKTQVGSITWKGSTSTDPRHLRRLRGQAMTMVFQDPVGSLNPLVPVGRQLTEVLQKHKGLDAAAAKKRAEELFELVGISSPRTRLHQYPFELSGGMCQRVMIAMALAPEPDLLIADEPTTALDVTVQAQIMELILEIKERLGMAMLLIAHDLGVVAGVCDRVVVMYAGRVVEEADPFNAFGHPRHPYTVGLIASTPRFDERVKRLHTIPGSPPRSDLDIPGCPFRDRCERATDQCVVRPLLEGDGEGSRVACWHAY